MQDFYKLRTGVRLAMTLSFCAVFLALGWPLFHWIGERLAAVWGIDLYAPVRYQKHGLAWFLSFLVGMLAAILIMAVAWYGVAIAWLVLARGWTTRMAYAAMVLCHYPQEWFKPEHR